MTDYSQEVRDLADAGLRSTAGMAIVKRAFDAALPQTTNTTLLVDEAGNFSVRAADPDRPIEPPPGLISGLSGLFLIAAQHLATPAVALGLAVERVPPDGVALLAYQLYRGGLTEPPPSGG